MCVCHGKHLRLPHGAYRLCTEESGTLGTLPSQNQKEGEQRVYVDSFCCIIRKAGASLRAATAPGFLSSVFPRCGESDIKVGETSMMSVIRICVCVSVCVIGQPVVKRLEIHTTG